MYENGMVFRRTTTKQSSGIGSRLQQGDAQAQNNLGVMYENGRGVPQDYDEAVKWYRLAAAQGDADAQNNLGVMYENGRGVPQDNEEASQVVSARGCTLSASGCTG